MASRRFFTYDPYDYYYASPYHHYPYPYYNHHHQQQPAAPARRTSGFFPVAADAEPAAAAARRAAAASPALRARSSVSIPVHFVGSNPDPERETKTAARPRAEPVAVVPVRRAPSAAEAAVTLQAAARGFMARKSVRAVREVEREAEEIERKVEREAEELRGDDARARIAVGEALMRLLLRLDAVRGAREYRRRVTKRVLALQDAVDALEPTAAPVVVEESEAEPVAVEMAEEDGVDQEVPDTAEHGGAENEAKAVADEMEVDGERDDDEPEAATEETAEQPSDGANLVAGKTAAAGLGAFPEGEWEMVTEEHAAPAPPAAARQEVESRRSADAGGVPEVRKVMEMVAALCERSAQQCAVIGALAERVDALERAVRRVEDAERRRRRAKKLRKEGKGSNRGKCYSD
ncbi:hypothetical protein HU200_038453 [Digitaria exilis]|uniref:BAG domain-containing protein n=1 Tax=Digitaria exilis TaxID=1010633 RepID=A0A835BCQ8_9POAL|nr:hypothetical protein HU200_038453 [Digitaria exilis]